MSKQPSIIIFASGNGSNAKAIYAYAQLQKTFTISAIFCNNNKAGIIEWANQKQIPLCVFTKQEFEQASFIEKTEQYKPQLIVLAGFLLKVPEYFIDNYRIINIHPALLPKYGGKGMYGHFVHEAVKKNNEAESGITIHFVNKYYDEGKIILQKKVTLNASDTAEEIANKVLQLEHKYYAETIEKILKEL